MSLDDDMFHVLSNDSIEFGFRVWQENRDRVVGFPPRIYHRSTKEYSYNIKDTYSIILTSGSFYHKMYHYLYTFAMDKRILAKIDELMNCEDIAMNMLVSHLTRRPPIKIESLRHNYVCGNYCLEIMKKDNKIDLNEKPISFRKNHAENRSKCVQYFVSIYGYNPLLESKYFANYK
jgi:alpha-1,4-N-acetylglucosaminyltransferase EXTL3